MSSRGGRKGGGTKAGKARQERDPKLISLMRLVDGKRYREVDALARQILNQKPGHALAQKALSFALVGLSRYDEAVRVLDAAIMRTTDDGELYNNRGIALSQLHRWDEAFKDFDRARQLLADDPELLKNIAMALGQMHRWDEAIPVLLSAIEKHPGDFVEAISMLGDFLFNSRRFDEAWTCYREIYAADKADLNALFQLVAVGLHRADWEGLLDNIEELREKSRGFSADMMGEPLICLAFPRLEPQEHGRVACNKANSILRAIAPYLTPVSKSPQACSSARRLKVGYISGDFRVHAVGQLIAELIERHDHVHFEFTGYATTRSDGSEIRSRLEAAFDRFVNLGDMVAVKAASIIRQDELDILVDLSGWTTYHSQEALAMRCAPVQATWLGYAGSLGRPELADYVIGDPVVTPLSDAAHYAERIAQLPGCYLPYDTTRLTGPPTTREAHGLPADAFVFCSFNAVHKYNPALFDLWCDILRQAPGSVLWLSNAGDGIVAALRREVAARGIAAERLVFADRVPGFADHLARVRLADLALDPFPYNSHSTGMDMMWAGVPLLALRGESFAGRVGASMLVAAELDELIADNPGNYLETAVSLYRDRAALAAIKEKMMRSRASSRLFDMQAFARGLEDIYRRMWANHCAGRHEPILAGGR